MAHSITHRVQRDGHGLLVVETRQDDGSHTFEIADGRAIVPFGVAVVYDPALPPPNQLKVYTPASWSDGLLAEDIRCVLAMLAEAADRADTLSSTC
jgi:YD repeat-containing protein